MKKLKISAAFFLIIAMSACEDGDSEKILPIPAIILDCSDDRNKGTDKEKWIKTLRVYEDTLQTAIQYYHEEGRFFQPCIERMSNCKLAVNSRFIEEVGNIGDAEYVTTINRTTGRISQMVYSPVIPPHTIWEGDCVKGVEPEESSTKF